MRVQLLVAAAATFFARSAASSPPGPDGGSEALKVKESATENYRGWDDDHHWERRWDHYFGDDGADEDDEDDEDGDNWGSEKEPWGHPHGDKHSWTHHGRDDDYHGGGDRSVGYGSPREEGGGEHHPGYGHHGDDEWQGHGHDHDHKASTRDKTPADRGHDDEGARHPGYGHHGDDEWQGHGHDHDHKASTQDKTPTDQGRDGGFRHSDKPTHGNDDHTPGHGGGKKHGWYGEDTGHGDDSAHGNGQRNGHGDDDDGKRDEYGRDSGHDLDSSHGNPGHHDLNSDGANRRSHGKEDNGGQHDQDADHGRHNDERNSPRRGHDDDFTGYPSREGGGEYDDNNDGTWPASGPVKTVRVAQQLRADTEGFVSDTLEWVNEIIGEDVAATLVVDTTFSLTKSELADLERGPCGSTTLTEVFPALHKFIDSPKEVNLLEDAVQHIVWTPSSVCTKADGSSEVEGGFYASFQVKCAERLILNVSIASTGSTPTIQGDAVEDKSLYINVDVWNGRIRATDAQGSIIGIVENRHFPENAADIQKNWTAALQECGHAKELSVVGVVGGGWTIYTKSDNSSDGYQALAVGYTESFGFAFAEGDSVPTDIIPNALPVPSPADAPPTAAQSQPDAGAIAASGATAYVQMGTLCPRKACAGPAVMSQLTSFYQSRASPSASTLARESVAAPMPLMLPLVAVGLVLVVAFVAAVGATSRRRRGYSALEITSQV